MTHNPARVSASRLGLWVASATAVVGVASLVLSMTTPPRSGAFCSDGCVAYPYTDAAALVPRDYLWIGYAVLGVAFVFLGGALAGGSSRLEQRSPLGVHRGRRADSGRVGAVRGDLPGRAGLPVRADVAEHHLAGAHRLGHDADRRLRACRQGCDPGATPSRWLPCSAKLPAAMRGRQQAVPQSANDLHPAGLQRVELGIRIDDGFG